MKKSPLILIYISILLTFNSCWKYTFNGVDIGDAKTVQVDFFKNETPFEPTLGNRFTKEMQDLFQRQTSLSLVPKNGDLHFEGEITDYRINPMGATSQQTAAQNRLTITVNVRFYNKLKNKDDFEEQFSFYSDFDANSQLAGSILENALHQISERIIQDIFNASISKWKS
tara:strand:- start:9091 stop:9600 length:510 start_codon:yes stop_codon:yes gene_type:complete